MSENKRRQLWDKSEELLNKLRNTILSPVQNEGKFINEELLEFNIQGNKLCSELQLLIQDIYKFMANNKI